MEITPHIQLSVDEAFALGCDWGAAALAQALLPADRLDQWHRTQWKQRVRGNRRKSKALRAKKIRHRVQYSEWIGSVFTDENEAAELRALFRAAAQATNTQEAA